MLGRTTASVLAGRINLELGLEGGSSVQDGENPTGTGVKIVSRSLEEHLNNINNSGKTGRAFNNNNNTGKTGVDHRGKRKKGKKRSKPPKSKSKKKKVAEKRRKRATSSSHSSSDSEETASSDSEQSETDTWSRINKIWEIESRPKFYRTRAQ